MAMAMRFACVSRAGGARFMQSSKSQLLGINSVRTSATATSLGAAARQQAPKAAVAVFSAQCLTTQRVLTVTPLNLSGFLQTLTGNFDDGR